MTFLDNIEKRAHAATPGMPGERWYVLDGRRVSTTEPCEPVEQCGYTSNCIAIAYGANDVYNAAYIAAANPAAVLAMVAVCRAAQPALLALREARNYVVSDYTGRDGRDQTGGAIGRMNTAEAALRSAIAALPEPVAVEQEKM